MYEQPNPTILKLAKNIKLLILDVDGVLTDGKIVYDSNGHELKFFNVKDGLAIKQLQNFGVKVAIITARESNIVKKRAKELNIKYLYQNQSVKLNAFNDLINSLNLSPEQIAYLGDDWPDLPVLAKVGLPALVQDAEPLLKPFAKYITTKNGGDGAVREFIYFILKAQDKLELLLNFE
jgi:3-deoxy-D-manno-octulosonate 8-phosphate phosphatase (KDO 8-P phosphatase)